MTITSDKTLVTGDILIDDKMDIKGKRSAEWEHVIFGRPYQVHSRGAMFE